MTNFSSMFEQQENVAPGTGQQPPAQGAQPAAPAPPPGLPPTGIQQQVASVNQGYQAAQQAAGAGSLQTPMGQSSLDQLARSLAQQYGLPIGRGALVDEAGNFLQTPEQLAAAGGRGEGGYSPVAQAANKMAMISDAITKQQNLQQQGKAEAALQTGLGQVQERGRGSLASLQTGLYQDLADLYSNQEFEAADFSYFIQREQFELAQHQAHRERKKGRKRGRLGVFSGIAQMGIGMATQNYGLIGKGITGALGSAPETGWF